MTKPVDETLAERGRNYGDFVRTFDVIQQIKDALKDGGGWADMPPERREALEMIAVKMGRLVSGDSGHADSWHDIAGYARLVEECLLKKSNGEEVIRISKKELLDEVQAIRSGMDAIKIPIQLVVGEPKPLASAGPRLCTDCGHYRYDEVKIGGAEHRCTNPDFAHVVTGVDVQCSDMRYGTNAKYPACGLECRSFIKRGPDVFEDAL